MLIFGAGNFGYVGEMSNTQPDPPHAKTTSDDSEDDLGLVDPNDPRDTPLGVEDPNIDPDASPVDPALQEWGLVEDDEETREWRTDHTEFGEDATTQRVGGLISSGAEDGIDELSDDESQMIADMGDFESSPEGQAMHIVEDDA